MFKGISKAISEFPSDMKEILTTPKTLALVVVGLALLLIGATSVELMTFMLPVMLFMGFLGWTVFRDRKEGYKIGWKRGLFLFVDAMVVISVATYGYEYTIVNEIHVAGIPTDLLTKNQWSRDKSQDNSSQLAWGLARLEIRGYQYDDSNLAEPPYPGEIWLISFKTVVIPTSDQIKQQVTQKVGEIQKDGLTIDQNNKVEGTESVGNGKTAHYIIYEATLMSGGGGAFINFAAGAKIKVKVEWWTCVEHGTAVIAVGAAQWGSTVQTSRIGNIIIGPQKDDYRTWDAVSRLEYGIKC